MTKPGRDYTYFILSSIRGEYDEHLLDDVKQISITVAGNENLTGYKIYKDNIGAHVVGSEFKQWGNHPQKTIDRANTLDLCYLIEYHSRKNVSKVVLGEVEGNKGYKLLQKKYWDELKPKCALFGIGIDKVKEITEAQQTIFQTNSKRIPIIIFPDHRSTLFELDDPLFEGGGLKNLIGYTHQLSVSEFIRFLSSVQPGKQYDHANQNLMFLFSKISKEWWSCSFKDLLNFIERDYINPSESQEIVIANNMSFRKKHYLVLDDEKKCIKMSSQTVYEDQISKIIIP